jgi:hypothetical protein
MASESFWCFMPGSVETIKDECGHPRVAEPGGC